MVEFVVNVVLLTAILVLLLVWRVSSARRRRHDRREQSEDRRAVFAALTGALSRCPDHRDIEGALPQANDLRPPPHRDDQSASGRPQLDQTSVTALLDLLEDQRRPRHGLISGLIASPRSVWSAGTRAGQMLGQRSSAGELPQAKDGALYCEAAGELVDIHTHDADDASRQYAHYAAAAGDPRLAELYVRAAAYAAYPDHAEVGAVLDQIIRATTEQDTTPKEDLFDADASIDA